MPDGQEKSDDLIAELARLMASGAAPEPEVKPGPKLVTLPDAPVAPVRVPGAAVAEAPRPAEPPRVAPVIRIPGMDQPVPSARVAEPVPVAPTPAAPERAEPSVSVPGIDLGPPPAAAPIRQEPLPSFRIPEPPRSAEPLAAEAAKPLRTEPDFEPVAPAQDPVPVPASTPEPVVMAAVTKPIGNAPAGPAVSVTRPQPEGDAFDFDFGFDGTAPEIAAGPLPEPAPKALNLRPGAQTIPAPSPRQSSGDLIADLIAAELDAADLAEPVVPAPAVAAPPPRPVPVPPPAVSQMPRANPTPASVAAVSQAPRPALQPATTPAAVTAPRPAAPAPRPEPTIAADRDPIDEIESLIGEAVRIELGADRPVAKEPLVVATAKPVPPPPAAPVVPPLTTGFAPRRTAIKDTEINVGAAEAAIRAAAADAELEDDMPVKRPRARREAGGFLGGGMRQYVGMAVAGTLLLAAGFGLVWVLGMGGGNDGEVPVLEADATPAKEPAPATPAATTSEGNVVFSEIDGTGTAEGEQLVSRDDSADTSIADVARTVGGEGEGVSESELANRKVRTVTVRPDGTIVSGDEAVAGNEALPVDRPAVPDLPGADVQPSELLAALPTNDPPGTAPATGTDGQLAAVTPPESVPAAEAPAVTGEPAVPGSTVTTASGASAPVPMPAPNRQALASRVAAAPAAPAPAPADSAPVASGGSGPYVQLSSQPSEAEAQAALRRFQSQVGGAALEVRRVDLGARGTWYRVALPTSSFQQATQTCANIKANGGDCVAING